MKQKGFLEGLAFVTISSEFKNLNSCSTSAQKEDEKKARKGKSGNPALPCFFSALDTRGSPPLRDQCLKCLVPVKSMAMPYSSAAAMTSASRREPPG